MSAQKIVSGVTLTNRAHPAEQMDAPRKMHLRISFRAYMLAYQRKTTLGEAHLGSAEPG